MSTTQVILSLLVGTVVAVVWFYSLVALVLDDISLGAKIVWFVLLVLLLPISVPTYLYLRHRRRAQERPVSALD